MDLINELKKHQNKDNLPIIKELSDIIKNNNIQTLNQLKEFEEKIFKTNNKNLTKKEKINYAFEIMIPSYDYEFLTYEEIQVYKIYRNNVLTEKNDDEKIKNLIKLYSLKDCELIFPFEAYNLIINDAL